MTTNPGLLKPETLKEKAPEIYDVTFSTTKGDFVVRVHENCGGQVNGVAMLQFI